MDTNDNTSEKPFNLFYALAGQERGNHLRISQNDHKRIVSTGILSLCSALVHAFTMGANLDSYLDFIPVSSVLAVIFGISVIFMNRTFFIYSNTRSKGIIIFLFLTINIFLAWIGSRVFISYYLNAEILQKIHEHGQVSPLKTSTAILNVMQGLDGSERRSIQNMRGIISGILLITFLLPFLNHLLFIKSQDTMDLQHEQLIRTLQTTLMEKQRELADLKDSPDLNDPFADNSQSTLSQRREELIAEILQIQRTINII